MFRAGEVAAVDQACRDSAVGKLTPTALYIHESALPVLSPLLRVYEGCARSYLGAVEDANIIKLYRRESKVSYLSYPDFDRDPHPGLHKSVNVCLQSFKVRARHYDDNRPILHRKELFVAHFVSEAGDVRAAYSARRAAWAVFTDAFGNIGSRPRGSVELFGYAVSGLVLSRAIGYVRSAADHRGRPLVAPPDGDQGRSRRRPFWRIHT